MVLVTSSENNGNAVLTMIQRILWLPVISLVGWLVGWITCQFVLQYDTKTDALAQPT